MHPQVGPEQLVLRKPNLVDVTLHVSRQDSNTMKPVTGGGSAHIEFSATNFQPAVNWLNGE